MEILQLIKNRELFQDLSFCLVYGIMELWNIGRMVFKRSFSFINILNFLVNMHFTNRTTLRLSTGNPLYHFPITQYSIIPLFQHSKSMIRPHGENCESAGEDNCGAKQYRLHPWALIFILSYYREKGQSTFNHSNGSRLTPPLLISK